MELVGNAKVHAEQVHAAIQEGPDVPAEDAVLVKWVVIADWMHTDGTRELTRIAPAGMPIWELRGLCREGTQDGWAEEADDDESA